jgi:prepilin peptidase CpaA
MDLTTTQALWFLPAALPICLAVAWNDLTSMRIPNSLVVATFVAFAVLGFIALPFETYLWRWSHLVVFLIIGMIANAAGLLGAGDAKFIAAAAPFFAAGDAQYVVVVLAVCIFGGFIVHRIAKHTALRQLAPDWKSWTTGKRFPMGFPLAMTFVTYLVTPFFVGA